MTNVLVNVNGITHKAKMGKKLYIHIEPVKGLHVWKTKEELEAVGCKVDHLRWGRN